MNLLSVLLPSLIIKTQIGQRFSEGGTLMMSLILICLVLAIFFLTRGFLCLNTETEKSKKMLHLASDSGLLGLVIGFLASILGLIAAFDSVEAMGNANPEVFAGGLKISLLTVAFGTLVFLISRIGILVLKGMQKI